MQSRRSAVVFAAAALVAVGTAGAAMSEPPRIQHEALTCVPAAANARIGAVITSGAQITSARVYFRAVERTTEYYLQMRRGEGNAYWAVLPIPEGYTKAVQYRIVVRDGDGMDAATDPVVARTGSCSAYLVDEEKRYANNLVVGLTNDMQPSIPEGFKCTGVVSKITTNGELRSNDECNKVPAALWIAGGAAALLGGGAIIVNNTGGGGGAPVSSSRPVPRTHP